MYVLLMIQIVLILYNISLYRYGLITISNSNETKRQPYNKMLFLNTNELEDDWGQFVNIEMI